MFAILGTDGEGASAGEPDFAELFYHVGEANIFLSNSERPHMVDFELPYDDSQARECSKPFFVFF